MGKVSTSMRSALILSIASLAFAKQQGVGPASTIQLQPGQFSVFGQPRQQPLNIPGTQGQVVAQFIDETGQSIPIQQLGQPPSSSRTPAGCTSAPAFPACSSASSEAEASTSATAIPASTSAAAVQPVPCTGRSPEETRGSQGCSSSAKEAA